MSNEINLNYNENLTNHIGYGSILTHDAIIKEINLGHIKISEPFKFSNVGAASVDLTLGNDFRFFKVANSTKQPIVVKKKIEFPIPNEPDQNTQLLDNFQDKTLKESGYDDDIITLTNDIDYKDGEYTEFIHIDDDESIILPPFTSCLGVTKEKVTLPSNICGYLEGRSRFARLGLIVHFTAGLMNPGINNKEVLEICNLNSRPLKLTPGLRIAQFIFIRTEGEYQYNGQFANQSTV